MTELDEERAAEVLEALAGWHCQNCGEEMRDPAFCDAGSHLFCPYCGMPPDAECCHLVTIADPDTGLYPSPFKGLELPHLPKRTDGFWPVDWSEADLRSAFGDLLPLLEAYERDGYTGEPEGYGENLLWDGVRAMLSERPGSRNRFVPDSPGSSYYEDAFFEDPDRARAEIAEIIGHLQAGFERLASAYEQRHSYRTPRTDRRS